MKHQRNYGRIHILQKEAGLTSEEYKSFLANFGVQSSTELTEDDYRQACATLEGMIKDARVREYRKRDEGRVKTPQERYFWHLWYELKGYLPQGDRTAEYLAGFAGRVLRRFIGLDKGHFDFENLEYVEQRKLIEALKQRLDYEEDRLAAVPF